MKAFLHDGSMREACQPHTRGGARDRLPAGEQPRKVIAGALFGGGSEPRPLTPQTPCAGRFEQATPVDLHGLR